MARKRKRGKKSKKESLGISDGVKQSILAVILVAAALIFLLAFFNLAGSVGEVIDELLSSIFGWDRWLFAVLLFVFGWNSIFPDRRVFSGLNVVGVVLLFLSLNGLLNLALVEDSASSQELFTAGGYIGMLVSELLASVMGLWGAAVISVAVLLIAVFLIFNVSLHSVLTAHKHFTNLGSIMHRKRLKDKYDEDEVEEDQEYDEDEPEEVEDLEDEEPRERILPDEDEGAAKSESVMTSRRRRKMEIPIELLDDKSSDAKAGDIDRNKEIIRRTFENFNIDVEMVEVRVGPAVTQYSLRPAEGVKLSRIVGLQNDLALALAAHPIRIEAPIPGRSLVGVEVPNQSVGKVSLREMLASNEFKQRKTNFTAPLGKDVSGVVQNMAVDKAPHALVAGATGSGKSVCLNDIIISLLYQNGPDDLKLIMVDPKRVELGCYAGIPHLLVPPITKVEEAINALKWAVREMERRLDHLAKAGARDIDSYNENNKERMPKVFIIIDELADLMSQNKRDVEAVIVRIAQMARAAGIHLVLATQRPSVDVITGLIKANIPTRLAFAVASQVDSKTILDVSGAEKLLGRGDMLLTSPEISKPKRIQGAYVSDKEINRVVEFLKSEGEPDYNYQVTEDTRTGGTVLNSEDSDPLLDDAIQIVIESGKASTSFLQRRLKIGYSRAARIVDIMEDMGVIGAADGAKPREILVDRWPQNHELEDADEVEDEEVEEYDEEVYDEEEEEDEEDDTGDE
ncbi:MAG: DNA translocase FtsK 4TM domain-containing protein [Patescibacteria group bacterium]